MRCAQFERDDPYLSELAGWIDEIPEASTGDSAVADDSEYPILSTYADAAKTYALYVGVSPFGPGAGGQPGADSRFARPLLRLVSFTSPPRSSWAIRTISEANTKRFRKKEKKADA